MTWAGPVALAIVAGALAVAGGLVAGGAESNHAVGPLGPGNTAEDRELAEPPPYERAAFGRWADEDRDCQDTRNEVLLRDLTGVTLSPDGCVVLAGKLVDPFTGQRVDFTRGRTTSSDVQIDHVLPLVEAWEAGAWRWTDEERRRFSNDLGNLLATAGPVNQSKGSRLPSQWVEAIERRPVACAYVTSVVVTVADWRLDINGPADDSEEAWIDQWFDGDCTPPLVGLTSG